MQHFLQMEWKYKVAVVFKYLMHIFSVLLFELCGRKNSAYCFFTHSTILWDKKEASNKCTCRCALLTGCHDAFAGGDNLTVCGAGNDHSMICLRTLQVVHGKLRPRHVGLQHQGVVMQPCHRDLKVHEELRVQAAPTQFQAAGGDVRDVQLICICGR